MFLPQWLEEGEGAAWNRCLGGDIALQREDRGEGGEKHRVVGGEEEKLTANYIGVPIRRLYPRRILYENTVESVASCYCQISSLLVVLKLQGEVRSWLAICVYQMVLADKQRAPFAVDVRTNTNIVNTRIC